MLLVGCARYCWKVEAGRFRVVGAHVAHVSTTCRITCRPCWAQACNAHARFRQDAGGQHAAMCRCRPHSSLQLPGMARWQVCGRATGSEAACAAGAAAQAGAGCAAGPTGSVQVTCTHLPQPIFGCELCARASPGPMAATSQ